MSELSKKITVGGFTFTLTDGNCYECRGDRYFDDDHDQVPEPKLQQAAYKLEKRLKDEGHSVEVEFGEKGWIEVYITED